MPKAFSFFCCGHCTGVFIGTRATACPLTKMFMPSSIWFIPIIFPRGEVTDSHYDKAITETALNALILVGPITMGRIPHGPLVVVTMWETCRLRQSLRLATCPRRGPHRSPSGRRLRHVRTRCGCAASEVIERRVACSPLPQYLPFEGPVQPSQLVPKMSLDGEDDALA
jgi:hypothetical protein